MKPNEIRGKAEKELSKILDEKREALFGLRLQRATRQLVKTATLGQTKREIARIETILREKEIKIDSHGQARGTWGTRFARKKEAFTHA